MPVIAIKLKDDRLSRVTSDTFVPVYGASPSATKQISFPLSATCPPGVLFVRFSYVHATTPSASSIRIILFIVYIIIFIVSMISQASTFMVKLASDISIPNPISFKSAADQS